MKVIKFSCNFQTNFIRNYIFIHILWRKNWNSAIFKSDVWVMKRIVQVVAIIIMMSTYTTFWDVFLILLAKLYPSIQFVWGHFAKFNLKLTDGYWGMVLPLPVGRSKSLKFLFKSPFTNVSVIRFAILQNFIFSYRAWEIWLLVVLWKA